MTQSRAPSTDIHGLMRVEGNAQELDEWKQDESGQRKPEQNRDEKLREERSRAGAQLRVKQGPAGEIEASKRNHQEHRLRHAARADEEDHCGSSRRGAP